MADARDQDAHESPYMVGTLTESSLSDTTASSPRNDSRAEGSFSGSSVKSSDSCTDGTPKDDECKEDFQGLFDELMHGITEGDMEGLDGYLSEGEFANMSSELNSELAWPSESEKKQKKWDRQEQDAEKLEQAAIRNGKLPRPCVGKPSQRSFSSPCGSFTRLTPLAYAARSMPLQEGAVQPRVSLQAMQAARHPLHDPGYGQKRPPDARRAASARRACGQGGSRGGRGSGAAERSSRGRDPTDEDCDGAHVDGGSRRLQPVGRHGSSACCPSFCIKRVEYSKL